MTKIKVCGITNMNDALQLSLLNIDYMGMIFYQKSPRYISPEQAGKISSALQQKGSRMKKVGVFVNESAENVINICKTVSLDFVQLHGDETPEYCREMPVSVIKVFRIRSAEDFQNIPQFQNSVKYILLDTRKNEQYGGTGQRFSWGLLDSPLLKSVPFFLSGGLSENNFKEALSYRPFALDFNSGVELSPGHKDIRKIQKIAKEIRNSI